MSQGLKRGSNGRTNSRAYSFLELMVDSWPYGRFIEIQINLRRKELHRTNQGSNFLGGTFSNGDNVRAPIQFGRESQHQHLKR